MLFSTEMQTNLNIHTQYNTTTATTTTKMEKASELLEPRYIAAVQSYLPLCAFAVCSCVLTNIEGKLK